jgi:hypothetical protein
MMPTAGLFVRYTIQSELKGYLSRESWSDKWMEHDRIMQEIRNGIDLRLSAVNLRADNLNSRIDSIQIVRETDMQSIQDLRIEVRAIVTELQFLNIEMGKMSSFIEKTR